MEDVTTGLLNGDSAYVQRDRSVCCTYALSYVQTNDLIMGDTGMGKESFDMDALSGIIDRNPLQLGSNESTAQLLNEEDENGCVVIVNESGLPTISMRREDYEAAKRWKSR